MRGWILFYHDLDPSIPEVPEIFRFQEAAQALGIALDVLKPHAFDLIVGADDAWGMRYQGAPIARPDFVLCRTGAETDYPTLALLRHLERAGVRLINGPATIELVADKLHTLQSLSQAGLPIPRTVLGKFPIDPDLVERELGFPVIIKTLKGTRGAGVLKCEDRSQFEDLTGLLQSTGSDAEFILQHYIRASHGRDVRVMVVGGRVVAAMERRSLTGGFKSNVSLGGVGEAYNPPRDMADLAVRAAEVLELDVTGIDILFDEEGYRICEANSSPGFQGLERASGMDIPRAMLEWVAATQHMPERTGSASNETSVLNLVFAGQTGLRDLIDRSSDYRQFAFKAGWRMVLAGMLGMLQAADPLGLSDRRGRIRSGYRSLFNLERQGNTRPQSDYERNLIITLLASIWAAVLPWLAGADASIAGALSLIALGFPIVFLLSSGRPGVRGGSGAGAGAGSGVGAERRPDGGGA